LGSFNRFLNATPRLAAFFFSGKVSSDSDPSAEPEIAATIAGKPFLAEARFLSATEDTGVTPVFFFFADDGIREILEAGDFDDVIGSLA